MTGALSAWRRATLGELGTYVNGRPFKSSEWSQSGRPIIRIQDLTRSKNNPHYFAGEVDERIVVRDGDLLVSWAATLGAYIWSGPEGVLNQHIFRVESKIHKRFHYHLVRHRLSQLQREAHGSGMVHVTRSMFRDTAVWIPISQRTQAAIADAIDRAEQKLDSAREHLINARLAVAELERAFLMQMLPFAVAGDAPTSGEAISMSDGWRLLPLEAAADIVMGQSPPGRSYNTAGLGLPFFQGKAEFGEDHPTPRKWCTEPRRVAEPGDILMSVRAPIGPTNVASQRCAVGRGLAVIRPKAGVPATIVRYAIRLQEPEIASWGTGTTFTAISKRDFARIRVAMPPERARAQVSAHIETGLRARRDVLARLAAAERKVEQTRQSLLRRVFRDRETAS